MKRCPHCHAPIHIETAALTEFKCGAGFEIVGTELQTWECDEANRARREAVVKESSTTDHSGEAGKMIPDPFAEDALRQLASDVLPADIKDAASEERLTWCAEQVRAQVNTLEARNRELVERIKRLNEAGDEMFKWSERVGQEYWMKAKEAKP